ncbi:MAG: FlgD immunoglobulin-like domain containing protein, partial [Candidatus Latescibacter sp.]|nr:FlgD immunoglobulin-like domain containing protein [Candidatus Latescibacter sp.]
GVNFSAVVYDTNDKKINNAAVAWTVEGAIGEIAANGHLTAGAVSGTGNVVASSGTVISKATVTVTENTNNKVHLPKVKNNDIIKLEGFQFPINNLNGIKLLFPEGSLSKDIEINCKIPDFANIDYTNQNIFFGDKIIYAIKFEVIVDGKLIDPFVFNKPIEITIPFNKNILEKLKFDPNNLGVYFISEFGELIEDGISNVVINIFTNEVTANVSHFSNIALAPRPTFVEETSMNSLPKSIDLFQNYPNPFNASTTISYFLYTPGEIDITVYNSLGNEIKKLIHTKQIPGKYSIIWNGKNNQGNEVTSGIYFVRMKNDTYIINSKILFLK